MNKNVVHLLVSMYRLLLRLYPAAFRETFSQEMTAVFRQSVQDAAADRRELLALLGRELRDWPLSCLRQHIRERNHRLPPRSSFSGWGALAAALPFLFYLSLLFARVPSRVLPIAFLAAGVLAAWWQRWPGWVVSWLGFLIFLGQNWLPASLLSEEPAWNTVPRLLNMLSGVAFQAGWLMVMYGVVRRWPRCGALVFLPFLWTQWAFSMEFASEAMTAVVFGVVFLILALTAAAVTVQRTAAGDVWLLYGAMLLIGGTLALGAALFTPGMESARHTLIPDFVQALAPYVSILLLQTLHAWSRENGRAARRYTHLMTGGTFLAYIALLTVNRLVGPSDLEAFQRSLLPALASVWLVGVLLVLAGGLGLRSRFGPVGKHESVVAAGMLVLLPLLSRPSFLSRTVNTLTYRRPDLTRIRNGLPYWQTVDGVLLTVGVAGLLLLPVLIGRLRRQTAAFPALPEPVTPAARWRQWRERRGAKRQAEDGRARRRRAAWLWLALLLFAAGSVFLIAIFLPLQLEAEPYTQQVALGDVDGDGDLDAVLANTMRLLPNADNKILLNDGHGRFQESNYNIGVGSTGVALLDSNGDGDLDVVIGGMAAATDFQNRGSHFRGRTLAGSRMPESGASQFYFHTGDLNGDGLDDAFMAGCCGTGISRGSEGTEEIAPVNRVLFGGDKGLVDSGQRLGVRGSGAVALGDLDGDGDLDAFVGNMQSNGENVHNGQPNEVWLNEGDGRFGDSGQLLGRQRTYAVALGDVDGDGDLDALVGNEGADELWLNDGDGRFILSRQSWSNRYTLLVFLIDLDGDGDLDALTGHQISGRFAWWRQGILWWNDGDGRFTRGGQRLHFRPNAAAAVGDVNGDGRPDIVGGALDEVRVWMNEGDGRFAAAGR